MSCYKRGKYWWYSLLWEGKRIRRSTKQSSKRAAEQLEAAHRTRLALGEADIAPRKKVTLREFVDVFNEYVRVRSADRPYTVRFYKRTSARLLEYEPLASALLRGIDEALIETYIQQRRASVTPATVNRELATLKRMLRLAVTQWKLLDRVPKITLLGGERCREFVLSRETETRYLAAAPQPLYDAAIVMLDAGLRVGELLRLTWDDISFEPRPGSKLGSILIRKGKSKNAKRVLSMTTRVADTLKERAYELFRIADIDKRCVAQMATGPGFVFPGRLPGKPVSVSWLESQHVKVRHELGLPEDCVIHSLRHTFGTRLGETGTDAFTIMKLMGHSSVTISQRYVHPTPDTMERAFERLTANQALTANQ
jgi:integrase